MATATATTAKMKMMMMMGSEVMAGGRMLIHDVHNHTFRNHNEDNYITNCNKYLHIRSETDPNSNDDEDDINGNEVATIQSHIRITENPLPPPPVNAASEDYIR